MKTEIKYVKFNLQIAEAIIRGEIPNTKAVTINGTEARLIGIYQPYGEACAETETKPKHVIGTFTFPGYGGELLVEFNENGECVYAYNVGSLKPIIDSFTGRRDKCWDLHIKTVEEIEFSPYDKVVVRNSESEEWVRRFFDSVYTDESGVKVYKTIGGEEWKYCKDFSE